MSSFRFWVIYISSLQFDLIITGWKVTLRALLCGVNWITHPKGWGKIGRNWESGGSCFLFLSSGINIMEEFHKHHFPKNNWKKLEIFAKNQGERTTSCQDERKKEWEESKSGYYWKGWDMPKKRKGVQYCASSNFSFPKWCKAYLKKLLELIREFATMPRCSIKYTKISNFSKFTY